MRGLLLSLVVLVLAAGTVAAADSFSTTLTAQRDVIFPDEVALFSLTITNKQNISDLFSISTLDFDWIVDTTQTVEELTPGETAKYTIEAVPKGGIQPGPRAVRLKVRSGNTEEFVTLSMLVSVRSLNGSNRTYAPSIVLSSSIDGAVDPREGMTIPVYMRNRNARNYESILVQIQSDIFSKEYVTSLGGIGEDGEKTNQVPVALDPLTPPGTHPLTVRIVVDDTIVNEFKTTFTILSFDDIVRSTDEDSSFFKVDTTYTVLNNGNMPVDTTVTHETNFFKRLFTTASAAYSVRKDDAGSGLSFPLELQPNEQVEITVTENYRLLFIFAVIVLLSVASYFLLRSPIVLRKEAVIVGSSSDGVSEIKLRLFVRNRSPKPVHNLHIIDKVTAMADVIKTHSLGTLQPSKVIKKKGHGTLVRWDIDALDGFEERIITYTVKTELKLIGDVYLPALKVKFEQAGRERTSYSNEVNIPRES